MMTENAPKKRGPGRPRKNESRVERVRPNRTPIHGSRDIITVHGKDPEYEYRWVLDVSEQGHRIYKFLNAGYEFAPPEGLEIGDRMVFKSENVGSIVRVPAGTHSPDQYMYLMRIHKDWYVEDQSSKQEEIRELEKDMTREREGNDSDDGTYGKMHIKRD